MLSSARRSFPPRGCLCIPHAILPPAWQRGVARGWKKGRGQSQDGGGEGGTGWTPSEHSLAAGTPAPGHARTATLGGPQRRLERHGAAAGGGLLSTTATVPSSRGRGADGDAGGRSVCRRGRPLRRSRRGTRQRWPPLTDELPQRRLPTLPLPTGSEQDHCGPPMGPPPPGGAIHDGFQSSNRQLWLSKDPQPHGYTLLRPLWPPLPPPRGDEARAAAWHAPRTPAPFRTPPPPRVPSGAPPRGRVLPPCCSPSGASHPGDPASLAPLWRTSSDIPSRHGWLPEMRRPRTVLGPQPTPLPRPCCAN